MRKLLVAPLSIIAQLRISSILKSTVLRRELAACAYVDCLLNLIGAGVD